jgi:hypothetical protein
MMKKITGFLLSMMFILAASTIASAQSYYGRTYYGSSFYMNRYISRIQQGLRAGELTDREAARLRSRVARVQSYELRARSDGYLDWRERSFLEREHRKLDNAIFRQSHDWDNRYQYDYNFDHRYDNRWNR